MRISDWSSDVCSSDLKARDKPGFFARGGAGVDILGGLADGLAQYFGGQPQYVPAMYKRQQDERNHNQRLAQMQEETRLKLSEPDYATINNRRVRIDPTTGKSEVLYTAPQDFDDYAEIGRASCRERVCQYV